MFQNSLLSPYLICIVSFIFSCCPLSVIWGCLSCSAHRLREENEEGLWFQGRLMKYLYYIFLILIIMYETAG